MKTVYRQITVFSDDIYLTLGLTALFNKDNSLHFSYPVIFIDVDRIKTISGILSILHSLNGRPVVVGIGRSGVISKYFSPLVFASTGDSIQSLVEKMRILQPSSYTIECWNSRCHFALKPSCLTQSQMRIFYGMKKGFSVSLLSKIHAIDLKTCYCHSGAIVKKLHLKNITDLRLLLKNL